jgi:hypothetical protein
MKEPSKGQTVPKPLVQSIGFFEDSVLCVFLYVIPLAAYTSVYSNI